MNIINDITNFFKIDNGNQYTYLILLSILTFAIISLIKKLVEKFYMAFEADPATKYEHNYRSQIVLNIINVIALFIIWEGHFNSLVTIISFVSAAATIALREIIFNFFAGIFIRVKKPFSIEDRIEVDGIKGDVVSINTLNFEVLEIGDRINGEQSSGIIVSFPNSFVLTNHVKNYVKEFKYIWNEITIKIPFTSDVNTTKTEIYKILKTNEILKKVPKKMENQIGNISLNYRIYFNNLEPVIYTKIVDDHIELYARYLVNPKKARNVEDNLWNQIIIAYKEKRIDLFIESH
jgi:small-conductance mechanosensitive channel